MSMILADCISYSGSIDNVIMIRHPIDKVFSNTRLEVIEGQEAVTCESGTLRGPYYEGECSLLEGIDNDGFVLDVISKLRKKRPFKCKTFFVMKNKSYKFNWGTGDLFFNIHHPDASSYHFGMSGIITVDISDSIKFTEAFVNNDYVTVQMLDKVVTAFVGEKIKANVSSLIRNNHMDIYYIEDYIQQISDLIKSYVSEAISDIGLSMEGFRIEHIKRIGEWVRPPMNQVATGALNRFQELTPSEKQFFFERINQLVTTDEDRALLEEVINPKEGR